MLDFTKECKVCGKMSAKYDVYKDAFVCSCGSYCVKPTDSDRADMKHYEQYMNIHRPKRLNDVTPAEWDAVNKKTTVEGLGKELADKVNALSHKDVTLHRILERIEATLIAKNADYGDSFSKIMDEMKKAGIKPETVFYIRAADKLNRIKSLLNREPMVSEEELMDTVFDLAGYSVLFMRYMEGKK